MKKNILNTLCAIILTCGFAMSFYNAANDYGLREIPLHNAVASQLDDTSGNGGDTTNEVVFGLNQYMENESTTCQAMSNMQGVAIVNEKTINNLKPLTLYTFYFKTYTCKEKEMNQCNKNLQGTYLINLHEGNGTTSPSGNTTNNN